MAFGYMDETGNEDLQIIPVSVNYSKPEEFRSRLFYDVGEPILVKEYYSMYKENNAKGVNELTREIEKRMRAIVPHLDDKANDSLINQLYRIYMERWMEQQGLDKNSSEHQQNYWFHAIHLINRLSVEHPQQVLELREKTTQYTSRLHQLNISDSGLSNFKSASGIGIKVLAFSAVAPFYYTGKILHVLPLFIAGKIADKTCKDIEFHSSVNVVTWSLLIQVFFLLELLMVGLICQSFLALLIYTIIKIGTGYFALRLSDWKKHLREMLRIRKLNKQNPDIVGELQSQRASILELLK